MKLTRARVTNYKSIDDSGWVNIENVTSLVGKNESGKTAFLQALKRLNPVAGVNPNFDLMDYPRKGYVRYKRVHNDNPAVVVAAEMELTPKELGEIEAAFGKGVMKSPRVTVTKDYANRVRFDFEYDEQAVVKHFLADAKLPPEIQQHAEAARTLADMVARLKELDIKPPAVQALLTSLPERIKTDVKQQIIASFLSKFLPRFVYFDDYSTMRGRISIQDMLKRHKDNVPMDDADRTFLSLLELAGVALEDLENERNYERLKAELESASIGISDEVFQFWNQNKQLRVEFDLSMANPNDPPPLNAGTILHVRVWNERHRVSVPFDERSKGFVWFFSFLAYFSKLEAEEHRDLVLLLDEPGLSLHALAQRDFLRFIEVRLSPKHQTLYTTHSPFMLDLNHLNRVRTVQDVDDKGTVISNDVLSNDRDTVFPLQVALSFQMAQTLFLAPHCLIVNSAADLIYLQVLGEIAASRGKSRLDPRWVVIPVGGADNLPTFLSLLGDHYMSVAVLMDVTPASKARMESIQQGGALRRHNPIKWVEVTKVRDADMEDLLDANFYLKLVNGAYARELRADLTMKAISDSNPRIVRRLETYFKNENVAGGRFDTYRPAAYLLQKHDELSCELDEATIEKAASLIERINSLLPGAAQQPHSVNGGPVRVLTPA
jgi:hypothetical protein